MLILGGEDKEIQVFKGVAFKIEKSIQKVHDGFINRCKFTPWNQGANFITVSADKCFKLHNTETFDTVFEQKGIHGMGVLDLCFTGADSEILTCSNDRTLKKWKVGESSLDLLQTYNLSAEDT